jgi:hypothetical protein
MNRGETMDFKGGRWLDSPDGLYFEEAENSDKYRRLFWVSEGHAPALVSDGFAAIKIRLNASEISGEEARRMAPSVFKGSTSQ